MLTQVYSAALLGVQAYCVTVEVNLTVGMPVFHIVGLPDGAVKEARLRLPAALNNADFSFPRDLLTINLAPADIKKDGTAFDLPMALGILLGMFADAAKPAIDLSRLLILGELGLDGSVSPIKGALPMALFASKNDFDTIMVPIENADEVAVVPGLKVIAVADVRQAFDHLIGQTTIKPYIAQVPVEDERQQDVDFSEVAGQQSVKRAMEVAAAGGHNIILIGPPGSGKSMLARRLPTILPSMSFGESLETSAVYSIVGMLSQRGGLIQQRPFRHPHHTISDVGLAGGGVGLPRPGEVSLAHHGVLFLDELPEFKRKALEVLRQPLEDNDVTINRSLTSVTFPANIMLVAAMNPCKCGFHGTTQSGRCVCSPNLVRRYRQRISGPLMDRIDLHIHVPAVPYDTLRTHNHAESSHCIRQRVEVVRKCQQRRFASQSIFTNAQMQPGHIQQYCQLDETGHTMLKTVVDKLGLSARAHHRILKVARTIADLAHEKDIQSNHLAEAIQYRTLDRAQV